MNHRNLKLEEKDIYRLLNEVRFDQSEWEPVTDEMPEILKDKIRKNVLKEVRNKNYLKSVKRSLIAAAVLLIILIGAGTVSPALARNIPVLHSIFEIFNDKFGTCQEYIPYSQLVDKSVTDNGITLTINEALADDSTLILGYTIKSDSRNENLKLAETNIMLGGLLINGSPPEGGGITGDYLDETTYVGVARITYHSPSASDLVKIDLNIDQFMGVKGHWDFSFTVSKTELVQKTRVFKTNNQVDLPEGLVTVDKIVLTPIDSTIYFSGNYKDQNAATKAMDTVVYRWFVFDDQGIELSSGGGTFGGNEAPYGKDFQGTAKFQAVKTIPRSLTIVPCRFPVISGDSADTEKPPESLQSIDGNYPLELSQGKMGKLIIKDITTEKGETVVRYTAEGKAPYFQGTNLYLKNTAGEYIHPQRYDIRRDENHPNDFTMVFPALDLSQGYSVSTSQFTHMDFMEDFKIKIELKK
ncbi:hypothetical protein Desor_2205 [Desulfosporosinus orientis DSM 765]|uniref:DUF4179 domain-containing protein n=1 Tax=Desulfosporosinus orientis (strain ATCC 19365 / DSM 765 / NCIMB 8382 / VKM B-1628 / Singapore I) TaxID=768706 RepID=G7W8U7_DESOD|nr:DUF4179 domain-containing protein [Desulfosporosinus orientis]AET67807.1 hypothetical protein Desor_2205 [Desulfosporosinus orientis DSM 765]